MNQLAIDFSPPGGKFTGLGTGPLANPAGTGIEVFSQFISSTVGVMTIIAIVWFIFVFILGAIGIMRSGGDKQAFEDSRKKITHGIQGLVVVIIAVFILDIVGYLLGVPDILNLTKLFGLITK